MHTQNGNSAKSLPHQSKAEAFAVFLAFIAICSYVVESPLKFALSKIGAGSLIYFRDAVAAGFISWRFLAWQSGRNLHPCITATAIVLTHTLIGILALGSIIQPLIGAKMMLATLFGISCFDLFKKNFDQVKFWSRFLLVVTVAGVGINYFIEMPWSGEVFDGAVGSAEISREWTSSGVRRLSGFARASYDAATIAACLGTIVLSSLPRVSFIPKIFVISICLITIALTTSKGALIAWVAISIYFLTPIKSEENKKIPLTVYLAPAWMLLIPGSMIYLDYQVRIGGDLWFLLSSFADRINWMWPRAFSLIDSNWMYLTGRGIGGIGFPQRFGEANQYNAADNAMIYAYINFGVAFFAYIYITFNKLNATRTHISPSIWKCMMGWLIFWSFYGMTNNMFENPFFSIFFGICIGTALSKKEH